MEEQWINELRKRFADREQPAPDGLWEDIVSAMTDQAGGSAEAESPSRRARVLPLWWRKVAVAAACAMLIVGVTSYFIGRSGTDDMTTTNIAESKTGVDAAPSGNSDDKQQPLLRDGAHGIVVRVVNRLVADIQEIATDSTETAVAENNTEPMETEGTESKSYIVKRRKQDNQTVKRTILAANTTHNGGQRGVSIGLFGMGLTATSSTTAAGEPLFYQQGMQSDPTFSDGYDFVSGTSSIEKVAIPTTDEVKAKHRQPIKAGLSVRFQLTDRLGLESGLFYTYLSSDFVNDAPTNGYKTEQRLHYVGVPLKMTCNVWRNDRIDVYAGAGGAVEIGVSGSATTDYVQNGEVQRSEYSDARDTRPQFSVGASAGVQYNLSGSLGVYLEPGVSYYINNGSSVQNFYKDKPWNFDLSVGLRFTLK